MGGDAVGHDPSKDQRDFNPLIRTLQPRALARDFFEPEGPRARKSPCETLALQGPLSAALKLQGDPTRSLTPGEGAQLLGKSALPVVSHSALFHNKCRLIRKNSWGAFFQL